MAFNPFLEIARSVQQRAFGVGTPVPPLPSAPPVEVQTGWGTFPGHAPYVTGTAQVRPTAPATRANLAGNYGAMNLDQCRCPGAK